MDNHEPENIVREVIETCAGCDFCGFYLEDTPCLVFPELHRLYRKEQEGGSITHRELRHMVELCNGCAMCPCEIIRAGIRKAQAAYVRRDGLNPSIRFLERVEWVGRICGTFPAFTNLLLRSPSTGKAIKSILGIHGQRQLPSLPEEHFPKWIARNGGRFSHGRPRRKVAYFVGCTGNYFFPEVPKAVIEVLVHNDVDVTVPEQKCCGMPPLLEGDQVLAASFVEQNVEVLYRALEEGREIVCSCPTCGYMLKELWKDEHYFAPIGRRERVQIGSMTFDLGEYLMRLHREGEFKTDFAPLCARAFYYPPCHLREQNVAEPYPDLLKGVSELKIERLEDGFYCCGMAGIMGYKREFHQTSIEIGATLMQRIRQIDPELILTDCLSCRLQFQQLLPFRVLHPVQMLQRAYRVPI